MKRLLGSNHRLSEAIPSADTADDKAAADEVAHLLTDEPKPIVDLDSAAPLDAAKLAEVEEVEDKLKSKNAEIEACRERISMLERQLDDAKLQQQPPPAPERMSEAETDVALEGIEANTNNEEQAP